MTSGGCNEVPLSIFLSFRQRLLFPNEVPLSPPFTVFLTETSFSIHVLSCLICVASSTSYGTVNYGTLEMNRLDFVA